jgi:hypothetical protein
VPLIFTGIILEPNWVLEIPKQTLGPTFYPCHDISFYLILCL